MKKSTEHDIDKLYSEVFHEADTDFDKSSMWSAVQSALPERNRRILFWLSALTGVLLMVYFAIQLSYTPTDRKVQDQPVKQSLAPPPSQSKSTEPYFSRESSSSASEQSAEQQASKAYSSSDKKQNRKTSGTAIMEGNNSKTGPATTPNSNRDQSQSRTSENRPMNEHNTSTELRTEHSFSTNPFRLNQQTPTQELPEKGENTLPTTADALPLLAAPKLETELSLPSLKDIEWSRCHKERSSLSLFMDLYAFGSYPLLNTEQHSGEDTGGSEFLEQWRESETAVASYAAGFMVGLSSNWGGSVSAGIEFQKILNKVSREQTVKERVTVYDEQAYFYRDSTGDKVWVADSVTTSRVYTRDVQMKKTHTLVNLPVLLSYHWKKNNWRFGLSGGVNIHIFNEFEGHVLDLSGQVIEAGTGGNFEVYKTDMNISLIGGLDVGYFLNNQWEAYISPRFRYNSKSWLKDSHPLSSTIQLAGLRGGVRFHFKAGK